MLPHTHYVQFSEVYKNPKNTFPNLPERQIESLKEVITEWYSPIADKKTDIVQGEFKESKILCNCSNAMRQLLTIEFDGDFDFEFENIQEDAETIKSMPNRGESFKSKTNLYCLGYTTDTKTYVEKTKLLIQQFQRVTKLPKRKLAKFVQRLEELSLSVQNVIQEFDNNEILESVNTLIQIGYNYQGFWINQGYMEFRDATFTRLVEEIAMRCRMIYKEASSYMVNNYVRKMQKIYSEKAIIATAKKEDVMLRIKYDGRNIGAEVCPTPYVE